MKVFIIIQLLLLAVSTSDFSGKWIFQNEYCSFSLKLKQDGTKISGQHCCIMQSGNRIDEASDEKQSISGTIDGNKAIINIRSGYSNVKGIAKLTLIGTDSLLFELTTPPADQYYLPEKVILTRNKK